MQHIRTVLLLVAVVLLGLGAGAGSATARGNVLPDATYETLIQANDSIADLNESDRSGMSDKEQYAEMRATCRIYPTDDPLLANYREVCFATIRLLDLTGRDCKTNRGCLRLIKRIEAVYEQAYQLGIDSNRIVTATVPAGACRTALKSTRSELRQLRELGRVMGDYMRASLAKDKKALKALEKRMARIVKMKARTPEQIQQAIEKHC